MRRNIINKGLKKYQEEKKFETENKVYDAIKNIKKGKKIITYGLVAEKSGVSKSTLYKNKKLKEKIKQTKAIQIAKKNKSNYNRPNEKFQPKKHKEVEEAKKTINKLKEENEELKRINGLLLGNLERKTTQLIELKTRLETLKKIRKLDK